MIFKNIQNLLVSDNGDFEVREEGEMIVIEYNINLNGDLLSLRTEPISTLDLPDYCFPFTAKEHVEENKIKLFLEQHNQDKTYIYYE